MTLKVRIDAGNAPPPPIPLAPQRLRAEHSPRLIVRYTRSIYVACIIYIMQNNREANANWPGMCEWARARVLTCASSQTATESEKKWK